MKGTIEQRAKKEGAVELKDGDIIFFDALTKNYGRAEFDFCARTLNGRVVEIHINRRQQMREPSWFIAKVNAEQFCVKDGRPGAAEVYVAPWRYGACKDHRLSFSVYVPDGTSGLSFSRSCVNTRFEFR